MGNSVSTEQGHRHADVADPGSKWSTTLQQAPDAGVPRQITVCLMPDAPQQSPQEGAAACTVPGSSCSNPSAFREKAVSMASDISQKVLLWNCNPTDSSSQDQTYAAAETTSHSSKETSANLNKLLVKSQRQKYSSGCNFDMHPAVSSDVACSLPSSSSSDNSSDSSFQGRSFSNEETMPHGPEHSSDEDEDTASTLVSHGPQADNSNSITSSDRSTNGGPDMVAAQQAGRLIIHPRSSTAAEQVVWVLHKQQLLAATHSTRPALTPHPSKAEPAADPAAVHHHQQRLASPAFILPCAKSPSQHVTTEWRVTMQHGQHNQEAPSGNCFTCQLALGLCCAPMGAPIASSSNSSSSPADCQAPGSSVGTTGDAVVHCRGKVSLHLDSSKIAITNADFDILYQQTGQVQELPLTIKLADNALAISIVSSRIEQQEQEQQPAHSAALAGRFEEVRLVVDFSCVRLLQRMSLATAAEKTGSTTAKQQQQQQQQQRLKPSDQPNQQHDPATRHRDQDHAKGSSSSIISRELGSSSPAARQLEAVLLSTSPRMLVVDGFFDTRLCNDLMELAEGKLVRSRVASGSETPSRTSWSHFFVKDAARQALIMSAEAQIEALFKSSAVRGPFPPLAKVEALQVVKYHEGEFYHEHYDNRADSPLTRAATIIVYLCDTEEGGATSFPRAVTGWTEQSDWQLPPKVSFGPRGQGIKVFPVQGRALIFWSKRADGSEDPNSIHAADTVVRGNKWIATRWMKDD